MRVWRRIQEAIHIFPDDCNFLECEVRRQKQVEVRRNLNRNKITLACLVETRVKVSKASKIKNKMGNKWCWRDNYSCSPRGRIWVGWLSQFHKVQVLHIHAQFIHCRVETADKPYFFFTAVYGLHTVEDRRDLWRELLHISGMLSSPWLLMGDFNSILSSEDRWNGAAVTVHETMDFQHFMDTADVCSLPTFGHYHSWSNKGEGDSRTMSRIDWGLVNSSWISQFGLLKLEYQNPGISDHSPLVLNCGGSDDRGGGRPFRFFNYMVQHDQFEPIVREAWGQITDANPMLALWRKLQQVKIHLKSLHTAEFANTKERIEQARKALDDVQSQLRTDRNNATLHSQEKACSLQLRKWLHVEESALAQKARIQWLKLGDSNNQFFFRAIKERLAYKLLFFIMLRGRN